MAFDVVMFGAISLPERNVEEWLTTPIEPTEFPWLDEVGGVDVVQNTPEALLAFASEITCAPHELFSVTVNEGRLEVQCFVGEDTFRETSVALALLGASTAAFGGTGELFFAGYQGIRFGERLSVLAARSNFSRVSADALGKLEQHAQFIELDSKIHQRFDALVGRAAPSGPIDPRRSRWIVHPFTGRKVRVADEPLSNSR
jgi:hypothetical protein